MKILQVRIAVIVCVVAGLLLVPAPANAAPSPIWTIHVVNAATTTIPRDDGTHPTATLSVSCPSGSLPVSGYITPAVHDDIRTLDEYVGFTTGSAYTVSLVDFTPTAPQAYSIPISVSARCVSTTYFSNSQTAYGTYTVGSNHLADGSTPCPGGWLALSADVSFSSAGETLLTSTPTSDVHSWHATGWNDVIGSTMYIFAHCVPAADLSGARVYSHADAAGWDTTATASCATGLVPIIGGTRHSGGDGGGFTEEARPTNTGWTSRAFSTSGGSMVTTVLCLPAESPIVAAWGDAVPNPNSTSAQWNFTATDPAAAGGYSLSVTCSLSYGGVTESLGACSSPIQRDSLADGSHLLTVQALTSDGRKSTQLAAVTIDTTAPVVSFADPANAAHPTTSLSVGFGIYDAVSLVTSLKCSLDDAAFANCGAGAWVPSCSCADYTGPQAISLTDLPEGPHVFHVRATDNATNVANTDLPFVVDTHSPSVVMTGPTARFTLASSIRASWTGTDSGSGVAAYALQWRSAPYGGDFGSWSTPLTLSGTTTSHTFGSLHRGSLYCYSTRATDRAGNTSPWAAQHCSAIPLDDRDLARSGSWTASAPRGYFQTTALSTMATNASLAATGVTLKRIAVVAKKCPTCGVVGVYVGSTLIGKINLHASTTSRAVIGLPTFSLRTGTVKLKVLSSGKLVQIDALGLSRL